MNKIYFLFVLAVSAWACTKNETTAPMSTTPEINFVSVAPNTVTAFKDSLAFTIGYKDGDGDLGENNANATNLFLTDNRINITYKYRINQLAPTGSTIAIQGNLTVVLKSTEVTDSTLTSQNATYNIYVVDRAGHKSNVITTSAVSVHK